jgi:hypothetical protein
MQSPGQPPVERFDAFFDRRAKSSNHQQKQGANRIIMAHELRQKAAWLEK